MSITLHIYGAHVLMPDTATNDINTKNTFCVSGCWQNAKNKEWQTPFSQKNYFRYVLASINSICIHVHIVSVYKTIKIIELLDDARKKYVGIYE